MATIRQATLSDVENLSLLVFEAWQKDLFNLVSEKALNFLTVAFFSNKLRADINNELETVIVYENNHEILGYCSGNTKSKKYDSEIKELYVSHKAQNKGIGSRLFAEMKSQFKSQNKSTMIVWTLLGALNNKFYKKYCPIKIAHRALNISTDKYKGIGFVYSLLE